MTNVNFICNFINLFIKFALEIINQSVMAIEILEMKTALMRMGYRPEYLSKLSDERIEALYKSEYQS